MGFTRGPANVGDLLASTLELMGDKLTEQWFLASKIGNKFLKGDGLEIKDGGESIVEKVNFDDNGTVSRITRSSVISVATQQQYTQAHWNWAGIGGAIVRNDWDTAMNAGKSKMFDLFEQDLLNLKEQMAQALELYLVGEVTPNTSSIWSLLDVIDSANPAVGNYGDIDRSSYAWWSAIETAATLANVLEALRTAYNTSSRNGMDPVSFIVSTQTVLEAYNARLVAHERLAQGNKGDLEFNDGDVLFHGRPIFWSEQMAAGTVLGINLKHTKMYVNKNMQFKIRPAVREKGGQDESRIVQTMCQLISRRPASNFKLTGLTA